MLTAADRPLELAKVNVTIANGAALSSVADLGGLPLAAIAMPAAWTAAGITLSTSFDGVTFYDVYDAGSELALVVGASQYVLIDFTKTIALGQYIRLRSGTAGVPVNQGGDRTLSLISRSF